ncbi:MAG TPA: hypothetical protein VHL98_13035 [Microvirga sp.]|jgi:hypothetical protein|nr:hypothetical protein [Microvirga sp.]
MAEGNEYYRESELRRFTRIGAAVLFVLVAGGFLLKVLADQQNAADGRDAMGLLRGEGAEAAPPRRSGPLARFQAERPIMMSAEERIRRWQQSQENEATGSTGPAMPPQAAPVR